MEDNKKRLPSKSDVAKFDTLYPLLSSILVEIKSFASKKQDGVLNPLKINAINKILVDTKELLNAEPETSYLQLLDEDTLPSYSDAVIICVQYRSALVNYRAKYSTNDDGEYEWNLRD